MDKYNHKIDCSRREEYGIKNKVNKSRGLLTPTNVDTAPNIEVVGDKKVMPRSIETGYVYDSMIDMSDVARLACVHHDPPTPYPSVKKLPWVALLVDGDGLGSDVQIKEVLGQAQKLGDVVAKKIYGNHNIPSRFSQWQKIYNEYKFERRIFVGVHKNIADMAIVAEAVELALTKPEIDYFVIVSHDGGFFPLMAKLNELGKGIYWIGGRAPSKKADDLRKELETKLGAMNNI